MNGNTKKFKINLKEKCSKWYEWNHYGEFVHFTSNRPEKNKEDSNEANMLAEKETYTDEVNYTV